MCVERIPFRLVREASWTSDHLQVLPGHLPTHQRSTIYFVLKQVYMAFYGFKVIIKTKKKKKKKKMILNAPFLFEIWLIFRWKISIFSYIGTFDSIYYTNPKKKRAQILPMKLRHRRNACGTIFDNSFRFTLGFLNDTLDFILFLLIYFFICKINSLSIFIYGNIRFKENIRPLIGTLNFRYTVKFKEEKSIVWKDMEKKM